MAFSQDTKDDSMTEMFENLGSEYQNLLVSISWLAPGEPLPLDLLMHVADAEDLDEIRQKLGFLVNMGFLARKDEDFIFESAVGKFILEFVDNQFTADILRRTSKEMHGLTHAIDKATLFQPYEKHMLRLAQQGQIQKIATSGLLFGLLGRYKLQMGENDEAIKFIRRALLIVEKVSGVESVEHTENMNNLGTALHRMGRFEDAKKCFEQSIIIDKKILGEDDPAVAIGHNNLGQVLIDMNSLEGAIIHLEKALELNEEIYGKEHPLVASGNYNLGTALISIGDLPRARAQLEMSLAKRKENYGDTHAEVADSHHALGMLFQTIGNVEDAIGHYQEAVRVFESINEADVLRLAASYANIGGVLHFQRKMDEAKDYYKKALSIFESNLKPTDKHIHDLKLQLKLIDLAMTMPELLEKMEAGDELPEDLMTFLNERFGED